MAHEHVPIDLALAVARGRRDPGDWASRVAAALRSACPVCAAALDALDRQLAESAEPVVVDYGESYERAMRELEEVAVTVETAKAKARPALDALLAMPEGARWQAVEAENSDFRGAPLAQLLLDQCEANLPGRVRECLGLAELAALVVSRSQLAAHSTELYARALAYQGNSLRVQGQLRAAAALFQHTNFLLALEAGGERAVAAEVAYLEASLCRAQRNLGKATELLELALAVYRMEEKAERQACALMKLSLVEHEQGQDETALALSFEAIGLLDASRQPRFYLTASHNVVDRLADLGQFTAARGKLGELWALYQRFPEPPLQLRRLWLEAKIHRGLGELAEAEQGLIAVRDGFVRQGIGFDAALASLDLALLFLDQGRATEVRLLAEEMIPIFAAEDVHREAAAALLLFQEAAKREQATAISVRKLFIFLEAARLDPELRFTEIEEGKKSVTPVASRAT